MYSKLEYVMQTGAVYASNNIPVLEISSNYVRFAIGSFVGKKPVLSFYAEEPIRGAINRNSIVDYPKIKAAIERVLAKADENLKIKTDIKAINLVIPPFGLKVYQVAHMTTVMSPSRLVDAIDIENLMNMCRNNHVNDGAQIIDIIPDYYEASSNRKFRKAPIGEKCDTLQIFAKIHVLPQSLDHSYSASVNNADLEIERKAVSSLCTSSLIATDEAIPRDYVLIDFGAHSSIVSLVGGSSLYTSEFFFKGSDDLTEKIASAFSLTFEEAERLKTNFGYAPSNGDYKEPLLVYVDEEGQKRTINQEDLNKVIEDFFQNEYCQFLKNAVDQVRAKINPQCVEYFQVKLVFSGGGSKLFGLSSLLDKNGLSYEKIFFTPKVIGARDASYSPLLGLIVLEGDNYGRSDVYRKAESTLSRNSKRQ